MNSSSSVCQQESLLASPQFFVKFLHLLALFELPIHVFGAYCILFKTPEVMSSVKWPLLNLHFWTATLDVTLSLLVTPVLTFPVLGANLVGVFTTIQIDARFQAWFAITLFACTPVSIIGIFEHRYNAFMGTATWNRIRYLYHAPIYVACLLYTIPQLTWLLPNQESALREALTLLPCLPLTNNSFLVITLDGTYMLTMISIGTFYELSTGLYFIVKLHLYLKNLKYLSKQSYELQIKFQKAVAVQVAIPMLVIAAPIFYDGYSVVSGYHNQAFNNLCCIAACFHGISSTLALIFIHQPYRDYVLRLISAASLKPKYPSVSGSSGAAE